MKIAKKTKLKVTRFRKSHRTTFIIATCAIILMLGVGVYFLGSALGWFGAGPATTGPATVKVIDIGDDNEDVSDKADVSVWECDISDMTTDDLSDIDLDDYDKLIDEKKAEEIKFNIEENHIYKIRVNYKDSEIWRTPMPGENVVMMVRKTSTASVYLEDEDDLSRTYEGNTDLEYYMRLICADDKEGLMPSYIYSAKDSNLIWLCFNFSRAAQDSMVRIDSYYNQKIVDGTSLYIGVSGTVVDRTTYDVTFGSGKAVTYDCNNIGWYFGLEANIVPTWAN